VLAKGRLGEAFRLYWDEMLLCESSKAYWALLHVAVCLPDICSALQSKTGRTTGELYEAWCDDNLKDPMLTGAELYRMRCKVLHQGRASLDRAGRYSGFSFGQPSPDGQVDHGRVVGNVLYIDVGLLAARLRTAVDAWIARLEAAPDSKSAVNAHSNLKSLVRVERFAMPSQPQGQFYVNLRTN
jgi:hypothetical protein